MLSADDRKQIAAEAIKTAELNDELKNRTWRLVKIDGSNRTQLKIGELFIESPDFSKREVHDFIAELLIEREMWKRRAGQHGCNVDTGDHECG